MTSTGFERKAKDAVVLVMRENRGVKVQADELQVVWFTHCLGNKKCLLWSKDMGEHYAEVTYNVDNDEMYVDIYKKVSHEAFHCVSGAESI